MSKRSETPDAATGRTMGWSPEIHAADLADQEQPSSRPCSCGGGWTPTGSIHDRSCPDAATTRLWSMTIEATFEASSVENAELIVKRLTEDVLDHVAVWSATGEFEPEQKTETVDV